jgi:hypothetical protein
MRPDHCAKDLIASFIHHTTRLMHNTQSHSTPTGMDNSNGRGPNHDQRNTISRRDRYGE